MPAMENNGGDSLARGAVRAQFRPMGSKVSQEKWDSMWLNEDGTKFDPSAQTEQSTEGGTGEKETTRIGVPR
jgi:hypothetical protein